MTNLHSHPWHYYTGRFSAFAATAIMLSLSCQSDPPREQSAASNHQPWPVRMAESEMQRRGDSFLFNDGTKTSWVYETGFFLKGIEQIWRQTSDDKYFAYLKKVVDSYVEPDGSIKTYEMQEY